MRISDWSSDVCSSDLVGQPCFDRASVRILEDSDNSACFGHQFALAFVSAGDAFGDNERALRPVVVAGVHLKLSAHKRGSVHFNFGGPDRFIETPAIPGHKPTHITHYGPKPGNEQKAG